MDLHRLRDRIGNRLLRSTRCDGELVQSVWANVAIVAVLALNDVRNLEARQLVKEGNLVAHELDEFVRVADSLSRWHIGGHLDTIIQRLQSLVTPTPPNLCQTSLDCIVTIIISLVKSVLQVRNTEHGLEGRIDPAGSVLVAKSEGRHFI